MNGAKQHPADWTAGTEAIVYQCCAACGAPAVFSPQLLCRLRRT